MRRETSDLSPGEGCASCCCYCLDVLLGSKSGQQPQKAPPPLAFAAHFAWEKGLRGFGVDGGGSLCFLFLFCFECKGTATPAFVSVGSKLALKRRAVRKHTDSHLLVALRYPMLCMGLKLDLVSLASTSIFSLTEGAAGRSLFLQSGCVGQCWEAEGEAQNNGVTGLNWPFICPPFWVWGERELWIEFMVPQTIDCLI